MKNKNKKVKRNYMAKLTIYGLPDMNFKELERLFAWLDSFPEKGFEQKDYAKRFTRTLMK